MSSTTSRSADKGPVILCIMDGWGLSQGREHNAVALADTPNVDALFAAWPHARLSASGRDVGLPDGQVGNSEVGHMNIGAGRVVMQDLPRINAAMEDGSLAAHPDLSVLGARLAESGGRAHVMGLLSGGGVHSHQDQMAAVIRGLHGTGAGIVLHPFTDGRDVLPKAAETELPAFLASLPDGVSVGTLTGRYYAMDRDKRWERVAQSYRALVGEVEERHASAVEGVQAHYDQDITDEFVLPFQIEGVDGHIRPGDVVLCFNFRTDRCREITQALTQQSFPDQNMAPLDLHYVTMTNYDESFEGVHVLYDKPNLVNTLGEAVSAQGRTQLRMAETEKYPHVTFFLSGGREEPFEGEQRAMAASPKVATYDLQPEMSAPELTEKAVEALTSWQPDFLCLNFANPDMVGHTGVFEAVVKAVETTDQCLKRVMETAKAEGYAVVVIADHGNADLARNTDGTPHTAHTTNPVPIWVHGPEGTKVSDGILADVAPTVLQLRGLNQPVEMTGRSLVGV